MAIIQQENANLPDILDVIYRQSLQKGWGLNLHDLKMTDLKKVANNDTF